MKKQVKKLTLNKETLRTLDESQMHEVAGGDPSHKYTKCGSCGIACTVDTCIC
jgi:natural product precursor